MKSTAWFDLGHDAVQRVWHAPPDGYVCPICFDSFSSPGGLTLEHAPPDCLGGKEIVLTCKACNNKAGDALDQEMLRLEQHLDFFAGTSDRRMDARMAIGGQSVNVTTEAHGSGIAIHIDPEQNNPEAYEAMIALFNEAVKSKRTPDFEMNLQFSRGCRPERAHVGWLRSAYLVAFGAFGYSYIVSDKMGLVRHQIADLNTRHIAIFSSSVTQSSREERNLILVQEPEWMRGSIAVHMGRHLVFLPGTRIGSEEFYQLISDDYQANKEAQVTGKIWPWPTRPHFYFDFRPDFLTSPH